MTVLTVNSLGKCYRLYPSPRARLKEMLTGRKSHTPHWALWNVSFQLKHGECLGIIGDNGAGKSTLLKLIAGSLQPTTGDVQHQGRLTAILELGTGFHPDFSGRDNVYFAGSLMGISRDEIANRFDEIVAFAELEDAIDRPVRTYSSGMFVRLAFSLITSVEPDILVVDEALSVGDQHFQKKCIDRMDSFRQSGSCTILFCSHSLYHIKQICSRTLWLHRGKVMALGETEAVEAAYENHVRKKNAVHSIQTNKWNMDRTAKHSPDNDRHGGRLLDVILEGITDDDPPLLVADDLKITVKAWVQNENKPPHLGILIERSDGVWVSGIGTHLDGLSPVRIDASHWRITLCFPNLPLLSGEYVVSAYLFDSTGLVVYEEWLKCQRFNVISDKNKIGLVELVHEWL
jgi:lipopolysaccharide transport system ATP-binding protein